MDWKGVGNAVIKAGAPLLGGALFGPAGSVIASIISGKFGVSPDATPDQVLTAIKGDPDAALKLRQIETDHAERLQELENDQLRIETADVQSARGAIQMVTPHVMERLSPTRRQVVITLLSITSPSDDPWVVEVYDAINNAFFEKAARLLLPHSSRLSRKMLMGE